MLDHHVLEIALGTVLSLPKSQPIHFLVFLYLGPETILPVASILASIIGVVLMFWRLIFGSIRRIFRRSPQANQTEITLEEEATSDSTQEELPKTNL